MPVGPPVIVVQVAPASSVRLQAEPYENAQMRRVRPPMAAPPVRYA